MTPEQEAEKARALLNFQRQFRDGVATLTGGPERETLLADIDALIARTRAHLERLVPTRADIPMVAAPEALQ